MRRYSFRLHTALFTIVAILVSLGVTFGIVTSIPIPVEKSTSLEELLLQISSTQTKSVQRTITQPKPSVITSNTQPTVVNRTIISVGKDLPSQNMRVRSVSIPYAGDVKSVLTPQQIQTLANMGQSSRLKTSSVKVSVQQPNGKWVTITPKDPFFTPWRLRILLSLLIAAAVLIPVALWASTLLTRPFERLARVASSEDPVADPVSFVSGPKEAVQAAQALQSMRARLEAQLRDRTAMMAAIAHDLRTPLTGLRIRAENLSGTEHDQTVGDIERMERMLAQLLAFVRGEEVEWKEEPVDLTDLTQQCLHRYDSSRYTLSANDEFIVLCDPDQMDRALSNLLNNALLYGHRADVAISRDSAMIVCTIDDQGPGMPPNLIESAFRPFQRLENSRNRATGGTGLGLAIAQSVATRAGGKLTIENRANGGLRATLRLPQFSSPEETAT